MQAIINADTPVAARRLNEVPEWFDAWERRLSRFRPESELMQLNRCTSRRFVASPTLRASLMAALTAARATGGLVTPTLLRALYAAGYDQSFDQLREGADLPSLGLNPAPDWRGITIDSHGAIRMPDDVQIDLGGTAKGWAADRAARRLGRVAPALINAGGDIAVSGSRTDGRPWPVSIADPMRPDVDLMLLGLRRGGMATSGRDYRRWRQGGIWQHHILDPRTGLPAATNVLSATVVASSAVVAEAAAKAALILGSRDGMAWIEARPELAGLLVLEDGTQIQSTRMAPHIWREADNEGNTQ